MKLGILGSGNAATGMAYLMAKMGHEVYHSDLPDFLENIRIMKEQGGVYGQMGNEGKVEFVKTYPTEKISEVLSEVEIIFITAPAYGVVRFAEACKPYIKKGHKVIFVPGSAGGSIEFKKKIGYDILDPDVIVGETSTVAYASWLVKPGHAVIHVDVKKFIFSSLPNNEELNQFVKSLWGERVQIENILFTILSDGNPVIHPPIMLLNAGRIENTKGDFLFYTDGVSESVGRLLRGIDLERLAIGQKLGLELYSEPEMGTMQGFMHQADYYEGYRFGPGFTMIKAPDTLHFRYLVEDVGYGLLLWSTMGDELGVDTPIIDSVINIASAATDIDFRGEAPRTANSLGLTKKSMDEITKQALIK